MLISSLSLCDYCTTSQLLMIKAPQLNLAKRSPQHQPHSTHTSLHTFKSFSPAQLSKTSPSSCKLFSPTLLDSPPGLLSILGFPFSLISVSLTFSMKNLKETSTPSPFRGPIPKISAEQKLENLFADLFSGFCAPNTDVCYNPIAAPSPIAVPSPIPYPTDIPMLPSSVQRPPQDQHSIQGNIPARIQNVSHLIPHDTNLIFPSASEAPQNLPVADGHSGASNLSVFPELEHADSPLPEPCFNLKFLENLPKLGAQRKGKRQANSMEADVEIYSPLITGQTESSLLNTPQCSKFPEPDVIPKKQGVTLTRTLGQVSNSPSPYMPGCFQNRDILNAPGTDILPIPPSFHIRSSDEKIQRPRKRQRRTEETERMKSINLSPSSPTPFSALSSQVDQMDNHDFIRSGNQSRIFQMPVIEDVAIQRNLMKGDIEYQWKTVTGDSAMKQVAPAANIDCAVDRRRKTAHSCFQQSVHRPGGTLGTQESPDSIQAPGHHTSHVNWERDPKCKKTSKMPRCSRLSNENITGHSSVGVSRRGIKKRMILKQTVPTPAASDGHSSQAIPIIADISKAKTDTPRKRAMDYRNAAENSSDPCVFYAGTNNQGLSEISMPQLPEVSGSNLDPNEAPQFGKEAMEPYQDFSGELERKEVEHGTHYTLMRLENPPECNVCGKLYITVENLKQHMKTTHTARKSKKHKCAECKGIFENETNLRRHIHDTHRIKNFFCLPCNAGFVKKRALVLHEKIVHHKVPKSVQKKKTKPPRASKNEKKVLLYFECLLCTHSTTVKGNLMRHVRGKHLNERPFKCPHCDRRGKTKQNIDFHVQVCQKKPKDATSGTQNLSPSP